ncbi:hypothetical protein SHELI_v1c10890 [Spiroplasma helicoides]|uniref:Transmembrane protein n=1 Tax=Spiroplasma helicoides TaxID=216938 RepID=A0A1B3SM79_9MOLU|nr:hypothetical protein [Spiroplasma helicoides]AOG61036.1 hypothetical protein SHELI_v1c10890 [Spiroplasma helicoides]
MKSKVINTLFALFAYLVVSIFYNFNINNSLVDMENRLNSFLILGVIFLIFIFAVFFELLEQYLNHIKNIKENNNFRNISKTIMFSMLNLINIYVPLAIASFIRIVLKISIQDNFDALESVMILLFLLSFLTFAILLINTYFIIKFIHTIIKYNYLKKLYSFLKDIAFILIKLTNVLVQALIWLKTLLFLQKRQHIFILNIKAKIFEVFLLNKFFRRPPSIKLS